ANYLGLFERGRTELLRQRGISVKEFKEKKGLLFAVTKVDCDYYAPAGYDDELTITTEIAGVTPARVTFAQQVIKGDKVLVAARITLCALSVKNFHPVRLPLEFSRDKPAELK
ncbi:MAG TPA: thioesterase family protein, partial [Candidatus Sulfotelmatobacter sp.]|nr:thioesterase family protein [Candidatus Sulfotelmatobacter sp.]